MKTFRENCNLNSVFVFLKFFQALIDKLHKLRFNSRTIILKLAVGSVPFSFKLL